MDVNINLRVQQTNYCCYYPFYTLLGVNFNPEGDLLLTKGLTNKRTNVYSKQMLQCYSYYSCYYPFYTLLGLF